MSESSNSSSSLTTAAKSTLITGDFVGTVIEDQTLRATGDLDASRLISNKGKVTERAVEFQEIEGKKGQYGTFAIEEDGSWSYKLKNTLDGVQSLAEGEVVTEVFKVVTETGAISYVTINVVGTNDIPVMTGTSTGALTEDDATSIASGKITVADIDHGQSFVRALNQAGQYGAFSIDANGNWTYTLDNTSANTQALAAGEIVTETFTVASFDGTVSQNVTVTITGTNDAPVITSSAQTGAVEEDGALTTSGQVVATDVDHGAVLNFSGNADGAYGSFVVDAATGMWTYILNNDSVQSLAAGEARTETFTVTVTDQLGTAVTQDVTVTITGTNDAPVITSAAQTGAVVEDGALTATGQVTASDVDNGATATFSGNADGTYGGFSVDAATGEWTYILNNAVAQSLAAGEVKIETFNVTVTDDKGATATQSVTVTITGTNDAPVITSAAQAGAVVEDGAVTATGQVTASDVDNGATASFSGNASGLYGEFVVDSATGQWIYSLGAAAQGLAAGDVVNETFTVTVVDQFGAAALQDVTVTVTGANDGPVITSSAQSGSVQDGGTLSATGQVTSSDADHNATASYAGNSAGQYGTFVVNALTGVWTYVLDSNAASVLALAQGQNVSETFTVTVTDDQGATTAQDVTISILGQNNPPTITSAVQHGDVWEDVVATVSGQVTAHDVDLNSALTWSVDHTAGTYGALSLDAAGNWTYTLDANVSQGLAYGESHDEVFNVTVTDEWGANVSQAVTVTVHGTNDAPTLTASAPSATLVEQGSGVAGVATSVVHLTPADVDGPVAYDTTGWTQLSAATYQKVGTYGVATLDTSANTLTYNLDNAKAATNALNAGTTAHDNFNVKVVDAFGVSAVAPVSFDIQGTADSFGGFMGHTVNYMYTFPQFGTGYWGTNVTVGSGVELNGLINSYGQSYYGTVNFTDSQILINFTQSATWTGAPYASFNGFTVTDTMNQLSNITGVTVDASSNMSGLSNANVGFTNDKLWVDWKGLSFVGGVTHVALDVTFA